MSNPNNYRQISIPADDIEQFKVFCIQAAQELGWKATSENDNSINIEVSDGGVYTGNGIKIDFEENGVIITLINLNTNDLSLTDTASISTLLQTVDSLKHQHSQNTIENESGFKSFLRIITPTKEYLFTPLIMFANIIVFILMVASGANFFEPTTEVVLSWGGSFSVNTLGGEPWRLLTACFLHYGILHLLLNLYALLYVGVFLEPLIGKWRFLILYLIAGIGGNVASLYFNTFAVGAGASGAVFGLYGAFLALLTTKLIEKEERKAFLTSMLLFVGYNLFYGFTKSNIDNSAHIGGLITGGLFCYLFCIDFTLAKQNNRPSYLASTIGGLALVAALYTGFSFAPKTVLNYENHRTEFVEIEQKTLSVFEKWSTLSLASQQQQIDEGIKNWERCTNLMSLENNENLPEQLETYRSFLFEYSLLRKKQYEAIKKWLVTGSAEDEHIVGQLAEEINTLLGVENDTETVE
ncbi:MAG: rhomboid family intramembrane serine protease [Bacteroidetes bacterium]|nr:MAG: rhomboid family intramembrane serine protease [Bacteroidota bacterium]